MTLSAIAAIGAFGTLAAVALYVAFRWRRAPAAKRAMLAISVACTAAGITLGSVATHLLTRPRTEARARGLSGARWKKELSSGSSKTGPGVQIHFAPPFSPSVFALLGESLEKRAYARLGQFHIPTFETKTTSIVSL